MRRITIPLVVLGFLTAFDSFSFTAPPTAWVVGLTGQWTVSQDGAKESPPLAFGSTFLVEDGTSVRGRGGTLVLSVNDQPLKFDCESACPPQFEIKAARKEQNSFSLVAAIAPFFQHSVDRYVVAAARGVEPDFTESVLLLQGQQVDLTPALQDMEGSSYKVRLESISNTEVTPAVSFQRTGGKVEVQFSGVKPGLYRLVSVDGDGEPGDSEAWVLLCPSETFATNSTKLAQARKEIAAWPPQADRRAPRAALRAYLEFMSQSKAEAAR